MMEWVFQIGLSNICIAGVLAVIAFVVGARSRRPHLVHLLWMLVLLKLVTPPLVQIPYQALLNAPVETVEATHPVVASWSETNTVESTTPVATVWKTKLTYYWVLVKFPMAILWLSGSLIVLMFSGVRVWKFNRLLRDCSSIPGRKVERMARRMAVKFGCRPPTVVTAKANIAPMVWWVGGEVKLVLPESLVETLQPDQLRLVIAHEMAHVSRRDYLVRWLEWFACVLFWCVPLAWWAQRNLRKAEEVCCDAMVLSRLKPDLGRYANSILTAVESLVCPAIRPPAIASEINSGGFLKRRIEMIISNDNELRWRPGQLLLVALATLLIPMGMLGAQDNDVVQRRLTKMVKQGHLTKKQAATMLKSLNNQAQQNQGKVVPGVQTKKPVATYRWKEDAQSEWDAATTEFARVEAKLKKAVVAGLMTKAEAKKKLVAYKALLADKLQKNVYQFEGVSKNGKNSPEQIEGEYILGEALLLQKVKPVVDLSEFGTIKFDLKLDESQEKDSDGNGNLSFEVDSRFGKDGQVDAIIMETQADDDLGTKITFQDKEPGSNEATIELRWVPNPAEIDLQDEIGTRYRLRLDHLGSPDDEEVQEVELELDSLKKEEKTQKKRKDKPVKGKRK